MKHLVIGPFARIGKNRKGTTEWILSYLEKKGLSATVVEPFSVGSERVSSNRIRECISKGDLEHAAQLLGRPFSISSRVVTGDSRGRKLNFPTANLQVADYVMPPHGVYFCSTKIDGKKFYALANFGVRPTFNGTKEVLEAYLMNFNGPNIYGKRIELTFNKKIRNELHFESPQALQEQIKHDIEFGKELIKKDTGKNDTGS